VNHFENTKSSTREEACEEVCKDILNKKKPTTLDKDLKINFVITGS
jgi:hypothetical protein